MTSKTILILGGGVGGLVTACELQRQLSSNHRIILIDREAFHLYTPSLLWLMLGWRVPEQIQANLGELTRQGIEFVNAEVQKIDPEKLHVQTSAGEYSGDYLVVSLGAQPSPELTPGFAEAAHTPYTLDGAMRLRDSLREFKGDRIIVVVTGLPYRCPAAPYETVIMIHAYLKERGLREKTDLQMISPEGMPMGTAGPEMAQAVKSMMAERGIPYRVLTYTHFIDVNASDLVLENGERVPFDLLVGVPPHRSPRAIRDTYLVNEGGWVLVDDKSLATPYEGVYAVGDVTTISLPGRFNPDMPLVLPKAGVFAHKQAEVLAHNIAVEINGKGKTEYLTVSVDALSN